MAPAPRKQTRSWQRPPSHEDPRTLPSALGWRWGAHLPLPGAVHSSLKAVGQEEFSLPQERDKSHPNPLLEVLYKTFLLKPRAKGKNDFPEELVCFLLLNSNRLYLPFTFGCQAALSYKAHFH